MNFKTQTLELLIDKMFNESGHFSVCDVDKIGDILGVNPRNHQNYKYLSALHCIDYSKMTEDFKQELQMKVAECVRPKQHMNAGLLASELMAEGNDFINTEDSGNLRLCN